MAFQVKLFVEADQEIRRFNLDTSVNFAALRQSVQELLGKDAFRLFWRDSDNDMVVLGSDEEFQAARQTIEADALLRVFVRSVEKPSSEEKKIHQCVKCDGCGDDVAGTRYKCVECPNYDLCDQCEGKNVHRQHNMIAIRNPDSKEWRRFFHGPRHHRQGQEEGPASGPCGMGEWAKHGPCGPRQFGPRPGMGGRCGPPQRGPAAFMDFIPPFLRPFIPAAEEGKEVNWEQINDIIGNIAQQFFGGLKPEEDHEEKKKEEEASSTPLTTDQGKPASEASVATTSPAERERANSVTESIKAENEQGWTHLESEPVEGATKVREAPAEKTTQLPAVSAPTAAAVPSESELKDQRIEAALKAMSEMGFPNEGDLLRRLLNNYNGDVARVLDSIK